MAGPPRDPLLPQHWFNILHDRPQYVATALPRAQLGGLADMAGHALQLQQPFSLARQSLNTADRLIPIPGEILDLYAQYRPTPLRRAVRLEQHLGANARIYYKYEGANLTGSHKLNTALAQAYYYARAGVKHIVTGTAAGQWGTALAYACKIMNLGCTVFMVRATLRQKPVRGDMMRLFGAVVHESPSELTDVGRRVLKENPAATGTQAVANAEALAVAAEDSQTRFAVGSGENSVLLHQTVIGQEALAQMDQLGEFPDCVIACMGAGSNFGGVALPLLGAAEDRGKPVRLIAVESAACPKLTRGRYRYDLSDALGTTPITKVYSLGSTYVPPPVYAGGLRHHSAGPLCSAMYADGSLEAMAIDQQTSFRAGLLFCETEGILPAPESAHAVAGMIDTVSRHPRQADPLVVLVNISGNGLLDLAAYQRFAAGEIEPVAVDEASLARSLGALEDFNQRIAQPAAAT
ncbi:MAG TPA: TrpB-like pyridoxal phosphate-dependent enzyme [Streptosporangiaceae bacterium]|nr:TrpB-like pyridoxal phosphate-dependent enzyme [Streptosporangiaceae bacterium]